MNTWAVTSTGLRVEQNESFRFRRACAASGIGATSSPRVAMACSVAWLKVGYYKDVRTDTLLRDRDDDMQALLQRLQGLVAEHAGEALTEERRAPLEREIEDVQAALVQQVEVVLAEGVAIDPVDPLDILIDPRLRDMSQYLRGDWIAMGDWLTVEQARAQFGLDEDELGQVEQAGKLHGADTDFDDDGTGEGRTSALVDADGRAMRSGTGTRYVRVWEIWSRTEQTVYTRIEGLKRWARPPFQPPRQPKRWYPFFLVSFNPVDHKRWPLSDVELLRENQDIAEFTRRRFYLHRKRTVPKYLVDAGRMAPTDAEKFASADVGEYVPVDTSGNTAGSDALALSNLIGAPPVVPPDPAIYDVTPTRSDMEITFGQGDAQAGSVRTAKTATEARHLEMAAAGRTAERRDHLEECAAAPSRPRAEPPATAALYLSVLTTTPAVTRPGARMAPSRAGNVARRAGTKQPDPVIEPLARGGILD